MLQARGVEATTDTVASPKTPPETPFPYGWRYVKRTLPTGRELYDQIPLTAADLLNPQLEDQVPQRDEHLQAILDLMGSLKIHYAKDLTTGVFSDLIMDWGIPGLAKPAPDIAIVPHLKTGKHLVRSMFKVADEGTRPSLIIEVMSPGYPVDDTDKVTIYARAGIPEYFLIQPYPVQGVPHYKLFGYQQEAGQYRRIPVGDGGPLISHTLQLQFEIADQGRCVKVTDLRTGRPLLTPIETEDARQREQKARQRERKARQREREARLQEQQARFEAEARAQKEADARAQAEVARLQEQQARFAAEAHAQAEADARAQLENRLRELEELLKSRP